jgi:Flp pilus assembly protein TadG
MTGRGRSDERGTVTLWVLGLCIALLVLAGFALDLWRAVAARRELSARADAAATAGANGLDLAALRAGRVRLDPARARAFALASLDDDPYARAVDRVDIVVSDERITVTLDAHARFSMLGIVEHDGAFALEATATAAARERD